MQIASHGMSQIAFAGIQAGKFLDRPPETIAKYAMATGKPPPLYSPLKVKDFTPAEQNHFGVVHSRGKRDSLAQKQAAQWFEAAAKAGDALAQFNLSCQFYYGQGGKKKNLKLAFEWAKKAADQGLDNAQTFVGYCYCHGMGVAQDYHQAKIWFEKSIARGNSAAMNNLGALYDEGLGLERNFSQAKEWYEKSIAFGNDIAINNLGCMYYKGNIGAINYRMAFQMFSLAAENNNNYALVNLGKMYFNGEFVQRDFAKASECFRRAANADYSDGQLVLGLMLLNGSLGKPDRMEAMEWLKKAATQGNKAAEFAQKADLSPILIKELSVNGKKVIARRKIELYPTVFERDPEIGEFNYYVLDKDYSLRLWEDTRVNLITSIHESLEFLWEYCAKSQQRRNWGGGFELKELLLASFSEES